MAVRAAEAACAYGCIHVVSSLVKNAQNRWTLHNFCYNYDQQISGDDVSDGVCGKLCLALKAGNKRQNQTVVIKRLLFLLISFKVADRVFFNIIYNFYERNIFIGLNTNLF